MKAFNKDKGFTLVEIIVVIGIMGVLSAIVYGSFNSAKAQSRDQRKISDMAGIQLALETYFNQNHYYPQNIQDLKPQYISSIPIPPMGDQYNYFPMTRNSDHSEPCISYQLWIKLEANNGTASSSKRGFDSTPTFPQSFANGMYECGSNHIPIDASSDSLVYDVVQ